MNHIAWSICWRYVFFRWLFATDPRPCLRNVGVAAWSRDVCRYRLTCRRRVAILCCCVLGCCARYASVMLRRVGVGWGGVGLRTFLCSAWWLWHYAEHDGFGYNIYVPCHGNRSVGVRHEYMVIAIIMVRSVCNFLFSSLHTQFSLVQIDDDYIIIYIYIIYIIIYI